MELQGMGRGDLLKLALNRRMSSCLVGARPCGFYLKYKGTSFCVSEVLGKGCQVESLDASEECNSPEEETNFSFPFFQRKEENSALSGKKAAEFKVYHRDGVTRSTVFLGKIIERRRKERGNNLKDLLGKAVRQYSDDVKNPSTIFLLGP
jgi:hypothetical protein